MGIEQFLGRKSNYSNNSPKKVDMFSQYVEKNKDRFAQDKAKFEESSRIKALEIEQQNKRLNDIVNTPKVEKVTPYQNAMNKIESNKIAAKEKTDKFIAENGYAPKGIFSKEQYEYYKKANPKNNDLQNKIGFIAETPYRIPVLNKVLKSVADTLSPGANDDLNPADLYSSKPTNKVVDGIAKFGGGVIGMGLNPGGGMVQGKNLLNIGDNIAEKVALKTLPKFSDNAMGRIGNQVLRGSVDGAIGGGLDNIRQGQDIKELPKNIAEGVVGGTLMFGGGKALGEVKSGINQKLTSSIANTFDEIGDNPIKSIDTDINNTTLNIKKPSDNNLNLPKVEKPSIPELPKMNIVNPGTTNKKFYQTMPEKTITDTVKTPKVVIRKEKIDIPSDWGSSVKLEDRQKLSNKNDFKDINSMQIDYPELKPHIQDIAKATLHDIDNAIPGKRFSSYDDETGVTNTIGQTKQVEPIIQEIQNFTATPNGVTKSGKPRPLKVPSYAKIRQALSDIVEDHGKENYALAKQVEKVLDDNLTYGRVTGEGYEIPPNDDYIQAKGMIKDIEKGTTINNNQTVFKGEVETPIIKTIPGERRLINNASKINQEAQGEVSNQGNQNIPGSNQMALDIDERVPGEGINSNIKSESRFKTVTSMDSENINDGVKATLEEKPLSYNVKTDEQGVDYANRIVNEDINKAINMVMSAATPTAETNSVGVALIGKLQEMGHYDTVADIIDKMSIGNTKLGQAVQKLSLLKRLTPEGMLVYAKKEVNKIAEEITSKNPLKTEKANKISEEIKANMDNIDNNALETITKELDNNSLQTISKGLDNPGLGETSSNTINQGNGLTNDNGLVGEVKTKKEKVKLTPGQKLARRVDNTIKEKEPVEKDLFERDLVNTLFNISKKNLPEVEKNISDPYNFVVQALKNKNQYQNVFKEAKDILIEKYGKDSVEYSLLEDWINQKARPVFYENNLNKAISSELKARGINLGQLVKEHYSKNSLVRENLAKTLIEKGGLNQEDANTITNYVNRRMKDLTKEAKENQLKKIFAERKVSIKKTDIERINELNNLNAFDNDKYKDLIYEKFGIPTLNSKDLETIANHMEKMNEVTEQQLKDNELALAMKVIKDKVPPTMWEKLDSVRYLNMLFNPKTLIKNAVGNVVNTGIGNVRDIIATPIDKLVSMKTGSRTVGMPDLVTQGKGIIKGGKQVISDHKLDIDTTRGGMKEGSKSRALRNIPVLGKMEKALGTGLKFGDVPFYQAAYDNKLKSLMKLNNVSEPTKEMLEQAHESGLRATFQQDTPLADFVAKGKQSDSKFISTAVKTVLPFSHTPSAILDTTLNYTPLGIAKGLSKLTPNELAKGNQAQGVEQLASGLLGTGLMGVGGVLASNGLLNGSPPKDLEAELLQKQSGIQPYGLKIGDTYRNIDWMQPGASPLMIGADIQKAREKGKGTLASGINTIAESSINSIANNSYLSGLTNMSDTISRDGFGGAIKEVGKNLTNQMMPLNSLANQINKSVDPTVRDTYNSNPFIKQVKSNMAKYPGLAQMLPQAVDTVGKNKVYNEGENILQRGVSNFVKPWNTTKYNPSNAEKVALDLYNLTGETGQMPRLAQTSFTMGNKDYILTPSEKIKLQKYMGERTEQLLPKLQNIPVDDRADKMKALLDKISKEGKEKIARERKSK